MRRPHISYQVRRRIVFGIALAILAFFYLFKNYSIPLRAISAAAFIIFFYAMDHLFDIRFEHRHYFYALFFAFFAFLLSPLYYLYPQYDKLQHIVMPMMFASMTFHMIAPLNLKLQWKLLFVFFMIIGTNGLFELSEYGIDQFTDFKLQGVYLRDETGLQKFVVLQDRIDDTMIDMGLGTLGAVAYVCAVALISKKRTR